MPLLSLDYFQPVFEPLQNKRIGFVQPIGNVGDQLIRMATEQMFDRFGVSWHEVSPENVADCDELVFGGGGNMGTLYQNNWDLRTRMLNTGKPITILPQSFTSPEDRGYQRVFVRERASLNLCPTGELAPDLALGLEFATTITPQYRRGVFLRRDCEAFRRRWLRRLQRDPVRMAKTPIQYLQLAAKYSHIITDRLHFAICGLILGRRVSLLRNSYHKNASLHESWLAALGCEFANSVREVSVS